MTTNAADNGQSAAADVLRTQAVCMSFGPVMALQGVDMHLRRGEVLGLVGDNGAGKSTLLKLVCGRETPDGGSVSLGASVKLGYFAQHAMDLLDPAKTVWDEIHGAFPDASIGALRTLAGVFGFSGDDI